MTLVEIINEIKNLTSSSHLAKPHKYLALLAAIDVLESIYWQINKIFYNDQFKDTFTKYFQIYSQSLDRNRPLAPYFHLHNSKLWILIAKPGKSVELENTTSIGSPKQLYDLVDYAQLHDDFFQVLQDPNKRQIVRNAIIECLSGNLQYKYPKNLTEVEKQDEYISINTLKVKEDLNENPFVTYLNSLHNITPNSENALAESQSINPFFGYIHVPSPKIVDYILNILNGTDKCHVILTGHAGDGKSTIGLEIYKKLKHLPAEEPLPKPLDAIEDILTETGRIITLVKDMSELSIGDRLRMLEEILETSKRYFIISNTGTLLETFRKCFDNDTEAIKFETKLLGAIDSKGTKTLPFSGAQFDIINLTQIDNIDLAGKILKRMINTQLWMCCEGCEHEAKCPLYKNVKLMQDNFEIIHERILLVYRRMFEYAERLTLRQVSAHLAYIITSGLTCERINELVIKPSSPLDTEFMFFNRFFGDNGVSPDLIADQLKAVRAISNQEFGSRPCPSIERMLWVQSEVNPTTFYSCQYGEFEGLRNIGTGSSVIDNIHEENARQQIRRMLYFLEPFEDDEGIYVRTFLNSPMILKFTEWQRSGISLDSIEKKRLRNCIMHVIKEHFSGVRLIETASEQDIYITLNRRSWDIRQSAQIVLAKFNRDNFDIEPKPERSPVGYDRYLPILKENTSGQELPLDLPFLDYVIMRHQGDIGYDLQVSYADRLERFKSRLIKAGQEKNKDNVILVRLKTDQTFRRQTFIIKGERLEVTNE